MDDGRDIESACDGASESFEAYARKMRADLYGASLDFDEGQFYSGVVSERKVFAVLGNHELWGFLSYDECVYAYGRLFKKYKICFLSGYCDEQPSVYVSAREVWADALGFVRKWMPRGFGWLGNGTLWDRWHIFRNDTLPCLRGYGVINMAMWNPWRGCHKHSEGCRYCYIHKGDYKRGIDTNNIVKTDNFYAPIAKNKSRAYKIKSG